MAEETNDNKPKKDEKPNITIIKRIKKGEHGHHGGAWKVAYADFVTAMMAFFLLLWLLNSTSAEQKLGISNYFEPIQFMKKQAGGAGHGFFGGMTVSSTAPLQSREEGELEDPKGESELPQNKQDSQKHPSSSPTKPSPKISVQEARKIIQESDKKAFEGIETKIRQQLQEMPELKQLSHNLIVEQTKEGLRIQIVDRDQYSMFPSGSSMLYSYARKLIELVAKVIKDLPHKLTISGHTDSTPFPSNRGYSNWELSTDRANACRRTLLTAGIDNNRIYAVIGKEDKDPLLPHDPESPSNRRISIVLLKKE
jgi:chemotaxis protein MotB